MPFVATQTLALHLFHHFHTPTAKTFSGTSKSLLRREAETVEKRRQGRTNKMARSHSLFPKLPSLDVCVAKAHSRSMMAIFLFRLFSPFFDLEENFFRCASAQIYTQKIFLFPSSLSSPMSPRLFSESCSISFTIPIHRHSTWSRSTSTFHQHPSQRASAKLARIVNLK